MKEEKDYKNILIDKILIFDKEINRQRVGLLSYKEIFSTWKEISEIAKLADAQRQEWAGK